VAPVHVINDVPATVLAGQVANMENGDAALEVRLRLRRSFRRNSPLGHPGTGSVPNHTAMVRLPAVDRRHRVRLLAPILYRLPGPRPSVQRMNASPMQPH